MKLRQLSASKRRAYRLVMALGRAPLAEVIRVAGSRDAVSYLIAFGFLKRVGHSVTLP
jgi:hypothetical protein